MFSRFFGAGILLVSLLVMIPPSLGGTASAQGGVYPCGGGPGPGQIVVGIQPGGTGVPPMPMCADDPNFNQMVGSHGKRLEYNPGPPPKPPKGWQPLYNAFVSFDVRQDEDEGNRAFDYGLFVNFDSVDQAQAAAIAYCRDRIRKEAGSDADYRCRNKIITGQDAYVTLFHHPSSGDFSPNQSNSYEKSIHAFGALLRHEGRAWICPTTDTCTQFVVGTARNGMFQKAGLEKDVQFYTCPQGPTIDGTKIVGVDATGGIATPFCGPDFAALRRSEGAGLFDAIAIHPRYIVSWAVGGFADRGAAEGAALDVCNAQTGGGCRILGSASDSVMVVMRGQDGKLVLGVGETEVEAMAKASAACSKDYVLPCRVESTRDTGDWKVRRSSSHYTDIQYYTAAATVGGDLSADRRVWFARNFETQDEADRYALQACRAENRAGSQCEIAARALGGLIVAWAGLDGSAGVFPIQMASWQEGQTGEREAMRLLCEARGTFCKVQLSANSDPGPNRMPDVNSLTIGRYSN